MNLSYLLDSD